MTKSSLYGLVLAGGRGKRLDADKGLLDYHGLPQARWAFDLLEGLCEARFVSVRAEQAEVPGYRGLASIVDVESAGPASGLLAALRRYPEAGWFVLAADMPLVDRPLLERLVEHRDPHVVATAYQHADGTPEPLCAIWEPAVLAVLEAAAGARGVEGVSLRRLLDAGPARFVRPLDEARLASVNTPADDRRVRLRIARDELL